MMQNEYSKILMPDRINNRDTEEEDGMFFVGDLIE